VSYLDPILRSIASRVGGDISGPSRVRYTTPDGVQVQIALANTRSAQQAIIDLTPPPPGVPRFDVDPGLLAGIFRKDIVVGHQALDARFKIKSSDEALVRRVWTQPFANDVATHFRKCRFVSNGTTLTIRHSQMDVYENEIMEQVDVGLAIVRFDAYGTRVLGELPEAVLVRDQHGFPQAEVPGPSRIVVGPVCPDRITYTRATIAMPSTVTDDMRRRIAQLGAVLESVVERTTIAWPSIEADRERLISAVEILRQLGGTSVGAFR